MYSFDNILYLEHMFNNNLTPSNSIRFRTIHKMKNALSDYLATML